MGQLRLVKRESGYEQPPRDLRDFSSTLSPRLGRPVGTRYLTRMLSLRACADRLATFHICRFSERLNRLLITHSTRLLPAYPRSLLYSTSQKRSPLARILLRPHRRRVWPE